jgi:Cu(I)/Ag(I) efflux system membrane protein CusA/SilA
LYEAIVEGAAKRLRPKFMTFATMSIGLIPILWSTGTGSEIMKRIAAPMIGGICTSVILELLVYPAIYAVWRERSLDHGRSNDPILVSARIDVPQPVGTDAAR